MFTATAPPGYPGPVSVTQLAYSAASAFALATLFIATPVAAQPAPGQAAQAAQVEHADSPSAARDEHALTSARQTFGEAVAAQEGGRYRDALALYERVRATVVSPTLLFNMAACHDALDELIAAKQMYERAVEEAKAKGDAEVEEAARTRAEILQSEIPRVVVRLAAGTEGAEATLDRSAITVDSLAELRVDPGTHRLSIRSEKHVRVFELAFEVPRRSIRTVDVDLGPKHGAESATTPAQTDVTTPPRDRSYVPALIAGTAALTLGAGSVVTGILGHDRRERYESLNLHPTADNREQREDLRSSGQSLYVANAILGGAALVAAGVAVYFAIRPPRSAPSRTSASLLLGPGTIGAAGTF